MSLMPIPSTRKPWAVALVVAVHLLALLSWPQRQPPVRDATLTYSDIVFLAPPKPVRPRPAPDVATPPRKLQPVAISAAPVIAAAPVPEALPAPAAEPLAEPAQFAARAPDILERARRDVGKIDRELRKNSLNMAERNLVLGKSKAALAFADVHAANEGTRIEESVMPDGRRISKVKTRFGRYCAYKESNGLVGGRDVFRDGVKTKISGCPN